jgi:hypothetical protein
MKDDAKKPDLVVFNEDTQQYDAALKPYGTSASSPVITPLNTASWKNDGIQRVNKQLKSKFDEVKKEYESLMQKFQYNDLIYNANFSLFLERLTICTTRKTKNPFYQSFHQSNVVLTI